MSGEEKAGGGGGKGAMIGFLVATLVATGAGAGMGFVLGPKFAAGADGHAKEEAAAEKKEGRRSPSPMRATAPW